MADYDFDRSGAGYQRDPDGRFFYQIFPMEGVDADTFRVLDEYRACDVRSVYICNERVKGDPATFVLLDDSFAKDKKWVYYRTFPVRGADAPSFEVLLGTWARDNRSAYNQHLRLKADRDSFVALNELYAKDRESAFYLGGTIKEADGATFETLDPGHFSTGPGFWYRHDQGYARDKNNVYHYILTIGKPRILKGVDLETFQVLGFSFAKDARKVYHEADRIPSADPASFEHLGGLFSRDRTRVFYANRTIAGADRDSFEVLDMNKHFARDCRSRYQRDVIIPDLPTPDLGPG
jgi:hypothetical protein